MEYNAGKTVDIVTSIINSEIKFAYQQGYDDGLKAALRIVRENREVANGRS